MDRTLGAGEFKAKCLSLLDDVARGGPSIVVTKRGKPVARVVSVGAAKRGKSLKGSVAYEGDILAPIDVSWVAVKR